MENGVKTQFDEGGGGGVRQRAAGMRLFYSCLLLARLITVLCSSHTLRR